MRSRSWSLERVAFHEAQKHGLCQTKTRHCLFDGCCYTISYLGATKLDRRWFADLRDARNGLDGWLRPTGRALARRGRDSVITGEFYTDLLSASGIAQDGLEDHQ